ncbi:MAG: hypothetical protein M3486_03715 [Actinomycetota bacterium]|nr:hypothetical protein [Actinomycetota bacterium]
MTARASRRLRRCGTGRLRACRSPSSGTCPEGRTPRRSHAAQNWPQLTLHVRFRGAFAYIDGHVGDDEPFPLCRLRYGGSASIWGFALYLYSSAKYEDQILPTGGFAGSPEDALDCACNLYLSGPTN